jgi:hypothetical protein
MQYLTIASLFLTSALAAPTSSAPLTPRACSVAYPYGNFPINYDIHQTTDGAPPRVDALQFTGIPSGAYGCQLNVNFPANYPITSSGSSAINIYSNNSGTEVLFDTLTLQSSSEAQSFFVNSLQCEEVLTFTLEIASQTEAGRVAFADTPEAGFSISYNC